MISFVIPAHNEQSNLGCTLESIHETAKSVGQPYEIVVVDDASTDKTGEIARQHGARVVSVNHRQIAATRNSGARAAHGERLFFVDADTLVNPRVVKAAIRHMDNGAIGGGAPARFDGSAPIYTRILLLLLGLCMRPGGMTGGAFMFCTRDAFQATGGFDERLFGAEDAAMCWALKRQGRFVVLWTRVLTSSRRVRGLAGLRMMGILFRMAFIPGVLTQRSHVKKIWYESKRDDTTNAGDSIAVRFVNAAMLLIVIGVLPFWMLIPRSWTPPGSLFGEIRWFFAMIANHTSLVLWPCAWFLSRSFFQQTRWVERVKILALIALCVLIGWGGTRAVIRFWVWFIPYLLNLI